MEGSLDENKQNFEYKPPPPNHGRDPPFSVLTRLFERVQQERKFDRRRRMIETWFKVSFNKNLFGLQPSIFARITENK